jgi:RND superfamily putative drug exporter
VFGLGVAVAVLVDATVVRMALVPSVMQLLGRANFWFSRWAATSPGAVSAIRPG